MAREWTKVEALARLEELIAASGLNRTQFAELVLGRDARTMRRWYDGGVMPATVRRWIAAMHMVRIDATGSIKTATKPGRMALAKPVAS